MLRHVVCWTRVVHVLANLLIVVPITARLIRFILLLRRHLLPISYLLLLYMTLLLQAAEAAAAAAAIHPVSAPVPFKCITQGKRDSSRAQCRGVQRHRGRRPPPASHPGATRNSAATATHPSCRKAGVPIPCLPCHCRHLPPFAWRAPCIAQMYGYSYSTATLQLPRVSHPTPPLQHPPSPPRHTQPQ
jgi:hypothetical protein